MIEVVLKIDIGGFKIGTLGYIKKGRELVYSTDCTKLIRTSHKFYPRCGYVWFGVNAKEFDVAPKK